MFIYEVNMSVKKKIYNNFLIWLKNNIKEKMLKLDGFQEAVISEEHSIFDEDIRKITVRYTVDTKENFEKYTAHPAKVMREEAVELFQDNFTGSLRFFDTQLIMHREYELEEEFCLKNN
jgi:hypothetical protein